MIFEEIKQLQNKTYYAYNTQDKFKWNGNDLKLLNSLNDLEHKWSISLIDDEGKTKDSKYNWNKKKWRDLLMKLSSIDWENSNL